ncbi:deoxyribose-phosphate aldolase [Anopheles sinensis]|uniref:Deoxyribose-phosphate aldolase n=1 Tax=Anopheles sinensis TaxID=74873 RepID=A0A084W7J0_ANOSI|nr:deoxyribose-phosphate aldolase [Anopheles sinensis]
MKVQGQQRLGMDISSTAVRRRLAPFEIENAARLRSSSSSPTQQCNAISFPRGATSTTPGLNEAKPASIVAQGSLYVSCACAWCKGENTNG